jgi:hypothetical protein
VFLFVLRLLLEINISSFRISAVTFFGSVIGKLRILVDLSTEGRRRELLCSDFGHPVQGLAERKLKVSAKYVSDMA